jgi:hypothetical protein
MWSELKKKRYMKRYNKKHKRKLKKLWKMYHQEHKKERNEYSKKYYLSNKDKIKIYNKNYKKKYNKKHRKELMLYKRKWRKKINNRLRDYLSSRLRKVLNGKSKSIFITKLIGCSLKFLKHYLEKQFKPGMSWNNYCYRGWHLDHIKPCASFDLSKPSQQRKCFHYTNLQPLWAEENMSKNGRIIKKE